MMNIFKIFDNIHFDLECLQLNKYYASTGTSIFSKYQVSGEKLNDKFAGMCQISR